MIGIVFASIGGLIGLALLVGGIAVLAAYAFGRDDGYFNSDRQQAPKRHLRDHDGGHRPRRRRGRLYSDKILGSVRIQVDGEKPVFVGIGADDDVDRYLGDVAHDELTGFDGDDPEFAHTRAERHRRHRTIKTSGLPSPAPGEQALTWDAEFGR